MIGGLEFSGAFLHSEFQRVLGVAQSFFRLAQSQMRSDPRQHFLGLKGLGDVINAAGLKTGDFLARIAKGADENNGDAAALLVCLQATAHLIAIHARHTDVEQDQVWSFGGYGFQRQSAVGCRSDAIAVLGQQFGQETQAGGSVIHHQNLFRR